VVTSEVKARNYIVIADIENQWVFEPKTDQRFDCGDWDYTCWMPRNDKSNESPVCALQTFTDENEVYREEWETEAIRDWDNRMSLLQKHHLSVIVNRELNSDSNSPVLGLDHEGQIALVTTETQVYGNESRVMRKLSVQPLQESWFTKVATALSERCGTKINACDLEDVIINVTQSGLRSGGDLDGTYVVAGTRVKAGEGK
jgi:hypothetical protein